jgi:hypothetical protein
MLSPNEMSVPQLEEYIANFPQVSQCDRANLEKLKQLLALKQEQENGNIS